MNDEAHKVILKHFCEQRRLSPDALPLGLADMICAATAPYLLMIECLDQLDSSDPLGGLIIKLIDRTYTTVAGSLALIALGHLREAEILSRSVFESAATTVYIVNEAPSLRFAQFFRDYVREEREQNRKWAKELEVLPPETQQYHRKLIEKKNKAMDGYEQFIDNFIRHCGVDPGETMRWPSLIDRLTVLGRRIEYRTVYAAMCSQTHHDAEDILNLFWANSMVEDADRFAAHVEQEADTFSIYMVLLGLNWFVEATSASCNYLKFPTVIAEALNSRKRTMDELELVVSQLTKGEFPEGWRANSNHVTKKVDNS